MSMNQAVKADWVAALRSGEYRQTKGALMNSDGHCCLGVLCDLYAKERGLGWDETLLGSAEASLPANTVRYWSELPMRNPVVTIAGRATTLSLHNDSGRTFAEIADAIEAQL